MKILYMVKGYAFSNILFGSMKDYKQKFTYMYLYQYMLKIDISKVFTLICYKSEYSKTNYYIKQGLQHSTWNCNI